VDFVQCLDSKKHAFLLQELPKELLGSSLTESYPPPTEEKAEENIKEGLEAASLE
jgi:hypothetical protein